MASPHPGARHPYPLTGLTMALLFKRDGDLPRRSLWQRIKEVALADVGVMVRGGVDQLSLEKVEELMLAADFRVKTTM